VESGGTLCTNSIAVIPSDHITACYLITSRVGNRYIPWDHNQTAELPQAPSSTTTGELKTGKDADIYWSANKGISTRFIA
jgi:hypothetical protein